LTGIQAFSSMESMTVAMARVLVSTSENCAPARRSAAARRDDPRQAAAAVLLPYAESP
jgi:hypothetical protein